MKLTDEQIAGLAPDWAKYYAFSASVDIAPKVISFYCQEKSRGKWFYLEKGNWSPDSYSDFSGDSNAKPIPRKEFDISKHEFDYLPSVKVKDNEIQFIVYDIGCDQDFYITKGDSIALAKHFKLTAEDLR